jgi:hypothetical protein
MFEELGRSLDTIIKRVVGDGAATPIDLKTDTISVNYPETGPADPVHLRLEVGVGKLTAAPGSAQLVDGTATYNIKEWSPEMAVNGGKVTLKQGNAGLLLPWWDSLRNDWDLKLGTAQPYELTVAKGVGEGTLALGGIPLTAAKIEAGTGQTTISFDSQNPQQASQIVFNCGAGELKASGLLNANATSFRANGGAGEMRLGFTGASLNQDMDVQIGQGVGEAKIEIKAGIPARVTIGQGLGDVRVSSDFTRTADHTYETPGYASATGPKLTMKINSGVGSLSVKTV